MKGKVVVAIDIGSTNIKTVIFDQNLNILANKAREVSIYYPNPGWTEYDPADWWLLLKETLNNAFEAAGVVPKDVMGVGVSSLGCTTVPMDKDGNHIYNAIPWHDHRAESEVAFLKDNCEQRIYNACGNIPTALSATPHLMWLKNNEPDIYSKIYKYSEASGFIVQKLTGEFVLDYSMASALDYGIDIKTLQYDQDLITAMGLDAEKYPQLHDNRVKVGGISDFAAQETGLLTGTPVYLGGLDIVTAALSVGAVKPGQAFYSMGSASNMMIVSNLDKQSKNLTSIMHPLDNKLKFLLGSQATVGFSFKWFSEQFCEEEKLASQLLKGEINVFELLSSEASKVAAGSEGLIFLPYLFGKFHPVFNADATGVFYGIRIGTTKAQMARAVMEGCTYNMYESIKSASKIDIHLDEIIAGGGPTNSDLWCQIIADVTNTNVRTINTVETTPLGSAILAGIGEGLFFGIDEVISKHIKYERIFNPIPENHDIYTKQFALYEGIYTALLPVYSKAVAED